MREEQNKGNRGSNGFPELNHSNLTLHSVESPKKLFAERTFRKTVTEEITEKPVSEQHNITQKTFTTESKHKPRTTIKISRKGNIVKEKCRQLTDIALNLFPDRIISHEDLSYLVLSYIGGNRDTVRAYMGYLGRQIGSSYGNTKWIGRRRKGYLETFGFMTHKGLKWIIHAQSQLFPPPPPLLDSECVEENKSKEKISLSQCSNDYTVANSLTNGGNVVESREKRERYREREKFYSNDLWKNRKYN